MKVLETLPQILDANTNVQKPREQFGNYLYYVAWNGSIEMKSLPDFRLQVNTLWDGLGLALYAAAERVDDAGCPLLGIWRARGPW